MKNILNVLTISSVLALTACGGGNPNSSYQSTSKPSVDKPSSSPDTYSMRGGDNSWPPANPNQASISDNLLAPNYYIVLDTSGSMNDDGCSNGQPKMSVAREAIAKFISKVPSNANLGLLVFDNGRSHEAVPISSTNHQNVLNAVSSIRSGSGTTPLGTSITAGYNALTEQAQSQLGYGEYHMVVVTDGVADQGNEPDAIVSKMLVNSAITLHTIGFCIGENHSLNIPKYTIYKSADNPQALVAGLDSVLAEAPDFQATGFKE